jgi:hypothetical protein
MDFILVGPQRRGVSLHQLTRLANVRWVRPCSYSEVPSWIERFDVGMIPFRRNRVSALADPIKLYEYCALGKPVVSTVAYQVGGQPAPIHVAATEGAFIQAIHELAHDRDPDGRAARICFARQHTWERRAQELLDLCLSCDCREH